MTCHGVLNVINVSVAQLLKIFQHLVFVHFHSLGFIGLGLCRCCCCGNETWLNAVIFRTTGAKILIPATLLVFLPLLNERLYLCTCEHWEVCVSDNTHHQYSK